MNNLPASPLEMGTSGVARLSGQSWLMEPKEIGGLCTEYARTERDDHQKAVPDYKFSPTKPGQAGRKRKEDRRAKTIRVCRGLLQTYKRTIDELKEFHQVILLATFLKPLVAMIVSPTKQPLRRAAMVLRSGKRALSAQAHPATSTVNHQLLV